MLHLRCSHLFFFANVWLVSVLAMSSSSHDQSRDGGHGMYHGSSAPYEPSAQIFLDFNCTGGDTSITMKDMRLDKTELLVFVGSLQQRTFSGVPVFYYKTLPCKKGPLPLPPKLQTKAGEKPQWVALVEDVDSRDCTPLKLLEQLNQQENRPQLVLYMKKLAFKYSRTKTVFSVGILTYENGRDLKRRLESGSNVSCLVQGSIRVTLNDSFINKTSVLFVSISFILLMIISLAWLVFYYIQRFRYIHAKERLSRRLANAAKKALAKIPVKTLKQGDKETESEYEACAICIESYRASETVRVLPCNHFFHKSCIDPWLLEQRSCPMCKLDILKAYGLQVRGVTGHHRGSQGSLLDVVRELGGSVHDSPANEALVVNVLTAEDHLESPSNSNSEDGPIQVTIEPPEVQYHQAPGTGSSGSSCVCCHEVHVERQPGSPTSSSSTPTAPPPGEAEDEEARMPLVPSAGAGAGADPQ